MTTEPNMRLMGLEAEARENFEKTLATWSHVDRLPQFATVAYLDTADLRFAVTYHPDRLWGYEFSAPYGGSLRGLFDCRESCLSALTAHMAVQA